VTRIRTSVAAALTTAVVSLFASPANAGPPRQMVRALNNARNWSHQRQLRFSSRIARGASAWARSMMSRGVLGHSTAAMRAGESEVIEWHTGTAPAIGSVVDEWLHSDAHRRIVLGGYRLAGAGKAVGWMNGVRSTIWVVRFAY
jgi:uncharacterized protein YkwD